jgi:ribosomal peptide maturation radical SAM protein 1
MRVALVHMPVSQADLPSLGLSLLQAELKAQGIAADIHYLNLWYASEIGHDLYAPLSQGAPMVHDLNGEWLFTEALWGRDESRDGEYINLVVRGQSVEHAKPASQEVEEHVHQLQYCRSKADSFLKRCLRKIDWARYDVVGFSSSFQQQLASLALAKQIKDHFPRTKVVFGGANCQGSMGLAILRNFSWVDAVCLGYGERAFADYISDLLTGFNRIIPGIAHQGFDQTQPVPTRVEPATAMTSMPYPNFDDYFNQLNSMQDLRVQVRPKLMIESSRGCWWGEKSHCTFCGLNAEAMTYRSKSAQGFIEELGWLLRQYGDITRSVVASDNIMPHEYLRTFLPVLKDLNLQVHIFYETKANLREDHIRLYRDAGIREFQPGIESLSTAALRLMRKGTTGLQNVQLLKWCSQYGVRPIWNYLVGFPGERPSYYAGQAEWVEALQHLPAPEYFGRIRLDRFSPYHSRPNSYGIREMRPYPSYSLVYPGLEPAEVRELAYFFYGEYDSREECHTYAGELGSSIARWQAVDGTRMLRLVNVGRRWFVVDNRDCSKQSVTEVTAVGAKLLIACNRMSSFKALLDRASVRFELASDGRRQDLIDEIRWLVDRKFMLRDGEWMLTIVLVDERTSENVSEWSATSV